MNIILDGETIEVVVTKKRMKRLIMRLSEPNVLKISCPYRTTNREIQQFIVNRINWIRVARNELLKREDIDQEGIVEWMYLFGKKYPVTIQVGSRNLVLFDGEKIKITTREHSNEYITKVFRKYAGEQLLLIMNEEREKWDQDICDRHQRIYPSFKVRYMTSRWGVYNKTKNTITLSTRLIHYPMESIQYVLLHEYVHILEFNHSTRFYAEVEKRMPMYKTYNSYLKMKEFS